MKKEIEPVEFFFDQRGYALNEREVSRAIEKINTKAVKVLGKYGFELTQETLEKIHALDLEYFTDILRSNYQKDMEALHVQTAKEALKHEMKKDIEEMKSAIQDISVFVHQAYNFGAIHKGVFYIAEGFKDALKQKHTTYLETEQEIELYNQHQKTIDAINKLYKMLPEHQKNLLLPELFPKVSGQIEYPIQLMLQYHAINQSVK